MSKSEKLKLKKEAEDQSALDMVQNKEKEAEEPEMKHPYLGKRIDFND